MEDKGKGVRFGGGEDVREEKPQRERELVKKFEVWKQFHLVLDAILGHNNLSTSYSTLTRLFITFLLYASTRLCHFLKTDHNLIRNLVLLFDKSANTNIAVSPSLESPQQCL